ncbi:MAG: lipopolysaccharide heptosyltransferase II [Thermodesulfovibrionales bacterium]|nr:lipopolysaccharide heptosyltransferase II [Thermodesulfovibrionales bacterium]
MSKEIIIKKHPKKILIVKPSSLGDIVHSLPFLNAIKNRFETAEIHWVVARGFDNIIENHPMINKLIVINKDDWKNLSKIKDTFSELSQTFITLKNESYDITIDLQGLLRSGIITYLSGAPLRIGFSDSREGSSLFYTDKIYGGKDIHAVDRYLKIARALGCSIENVIFPLPLVFESDKIKEFKASIKDYALIIPGARWKTKIFPPEKFSQIIKMLNITSVIIGSKADIEIADLIVKYSDGKAISIAGNTTIEELIHLIRGARFVISNDSGPMHIAAACNIPVIAIFGPTNPKRTGPYGDKHIVIKANLSCSPCYKKRCSSLACMNNISADHIYEKIIEKGVTQR